MYWSDDNATEPEYLVPDDVSDLVFRLHGSHLDIDHAYALAQALQEFLDAATCSRIGVHGIGMADSGNGWNRPQQADAALPLSRRARLVIRVHRDDRAAVSRITDQTLQIGAQAVAVGTSSVRPLSALGTLHARSICCERDQSEVDFLEQVAARLDDLNIRVSRMICGKARDIRTGDDKIFTRSLLVANLKPEEAVILQQRGIGAERLLGCGLFVPHRGIEAVHNVQ